MNNKNYVLNLENIMNFIFDEDNRNNEQEITEVYSADDDEKNKLNLITKQLREVKSGDTTKITMKYDFVRALVDVLLTIEDGEELTFSETLSINTLLSSGLLSEINN